MIVVTVEKLLKVVKVVTVLTVETKNCDKKIVMTKKSWGKTRFEEKCLLMTKKLWWHLI